MSVNLLRKAAFAMQNDGIKLVGTRWNQVVICCKRFRPPPWLDRPSTKTTYPQSNQPKAPLPTLPSFLLSQLKSMKEAGPRSFLAEFQWRWRAWPHVGHWKSTLRNLSAKKLSSLKSWATLWSVNVPSRLLRKSNTKWNSSNKARRFTRFTKETGIRIIHIRIKAGGTCISLPLEWKDLSLLALLLQISCDFLGSDAPLNKSLGECWLPFDPVSFDCIQWTGGGNSREVLSSWGVRQNDSLSWRREAFLRTSGMN